MSFFTNYTNLCRVAGSAPNAVAKVIGVSSGSVTNWKKGLIPKSETLLKIADYFNVSVDYLLNGETEQKNISEIQDEDIIILNRAAKKMTPENRKKLMDMAKLMFEEAFKND